MSVQNLQISLKKKTIQNFERNTPTLNPTKNSHKSDSVCFIRFFVLILLLLYSFEDSLYLQRREIDLHNLRFSPFKITMSPTHANAISKRGRNGWKCCGTTVRWFLIYETAETRIQAKGFTERVFWSALSFGPRLPRLPVYFLSNFRFLVCRSPMTFDKYFTCCRYRHERRLPRRLCCRSSSVSKWAHVPPSIPILQFFVFVRIFELSNSIRFYFYAYRIWFRDSSFLFPPFSFFIFERDLGDCWKFRSRRI